MFKRLLNPLRTSSFFIFGARGTGKSTFIKQQFSAERSFYIDLLKPENEMRYSVSPQSLVGELDALHFKPKWIIIDEIQKAPKILDLVHSLIENRNLKFILTGSSARKLKRGAANLLAGRAFIYHLYPLTIQELNEFKIEEILRWGSLPRIFSLKTNREKKAYLNAYIQTYFAEEIRAEQIIRRLDPFRAFLPILGQVSGKVINHNKIAKEIGTSSITVQSYFQIVEDTLLGFYLPAFHLSIRKSQRLSPKFYVFDTGVKKALEQSLDQEVSPRTSVYGELFECFIINEVVRLNSYFEKGFRLSYFATKNNVEIDLVLTFGCCHFLLEIKSNSRIDETEVNSMKEIIASFPKVKRAFYISNDTTHQRIGPVECLSWREFLKNFSKL